MVQVNKHDNSFALLDPISPISLIKQWASPFLGACAQAAQVQSVQRFFRASRC